MLRKGILIPVLTAASLLLTQCRMVECNVKVVDVDTRLWSEKATVTFVNGDTTSMRDMNVMLHVNRTFEAERVQLEIGMLTPDSLRYCERVTLPVDIEWGVNQQYIDVELPYRRNVHLAHEGEYIISLTPVTAVSGVEAAGINFQTTTKQIE